MNTIFLKDEEIRSQYHETLNKLENTLLFYFLLMSTIFIVVIYKRTLNILDIEFSANSWPVIIPTIIALLNFNISGKVQYLSRLYRHATLKETRDSLFSITVNHSMILNPFKLLGKTKEVILGWNLFYIAIHAIFTTSLILTGKLEVAGYHHNFLMLLFVSLLYLCSIRVLDFALQRHFTFMWKEKYPRHRFFSDDSSKI